MSATNNVCCLCGDIGFPDKLFRCNKCCNRLQHSYCTNYYDDSSSVANVSCDWCLHEERGSITTATAATSGKKQISSSGKRSSSSSSGKDHEYNSSGEKIKKNDKESTTSTDQSKGKNSGSPSPRTAGRRYKFLKDVLC
ncbi:hypothetical protein C5167_044576 [Papaver somniferum]|uniref:PHD-type zinc finger plants domain-containing protein n=1 Tax=Papaver somniferum TaxID=3469 RepID=A0A4Y7LBV9_PAPSO|nr:uncharacterized protein LOC113319468 [Papaver somniferum]RZC82008.1 hypothetical protein C5167_044576 [Papaver somniferum]